MNRNVQIGDLGLTVGDETFSNHYFTDHVSLASILEIDRGPCS